MHPVEVPPAIPFDRAQMERELSTEMGALSQAILEASGSLAPRIGAQSTIDTLLTCSAVAAHALHLDRTFWLSAAKKAWDQADHLVRTMPKAGPPSR